MAVAQEKKVESPLPDHQGSPLAPALSLLSAASRQRFAQCHPEERSDGSPQPGRYRVKGQNDSSLVTLPGFEHLVKAQLRAIDLYGV